MNFSELDPILIYKAPGNKALPCIFNGVFSIVPPPEFTLVLKTIGVSAIWFWIKGKPLLIEIFKLSLLPTVNPGSKNLVRLGNTLFASRIKSVELNPFNLSALDAVPQNL